MVSTGCPGYPTATLDELTEAGLVVLADGPHGPMWRATLTEAGQARYGELLARYRAHLARAELEVPGPEFAVNVRPLYSSERDPATTQTRPIAG